jgi:hypothetical protein
MAYNSVIEQVFDELKAFISAYLPQVLDQYEQVQPDIKLPFPRQFIRGDYQIADIRPGMFPTIIVKPGLVSINADSSMRTTSKDLVNIELSYWIVNALNSSTARFEAIENLQRMNERYAWALKEVIDSPAYIPTQTSLIGAIRSVTQVDWSIVEQGNNVSIGAVFVDINLKLQLNRS